MRKYFLLSAVALMFTTTANATTDYAEVTAKATIQVAGTVECSDMDFGTIVVKQNNSEIQIDSEMNIELGEPIDNDSFISMTGAHISDCSSTDEEYLNVSEHNITLINSNGDKLDFAIHGTDPKVAGVLTIPAFVEPGDYTGTYTVTFTY